MRSKTWLMMLTTCFAAGIFTLPVSVNSEYAWGTPYQGMMLTTNSDSSPKTSALSLQDWLGLIGGSVGLLTFGIGIYQYAVAQKWKRAEFVAKQIKEFEADPVIKNMLLALDWNDRTLAFSDAEQDIFKVDDVLLTQALKPKNHFSHHESLLRDAFSELLDRLERFEAHIQAGLVNKEEFQPYLAYWLDILGNPNSERKPPEFYDSLGMFLTKYNYKGVRKLLLRFGYTLPDPPLPSHPSPVTLSESQRNFMQHPIFTGQCPQCGAKCPDPFSPNWPCSSCGWVDPHSENLLENQEFK